MVNNKYNIRSNNVLLVLQNIIKYGIISRVELSKIVGLNKATISDITNKLLEDELIEIIGVGEGKELGGRKPVLLKFNSRSGVAIAIDLGSDYYAYSISYLDGERLTLDKVKDIKINASNAPAIVKEIVNKNKAFYENLKFGLVGIGISIHGIVNENKIIFTPHYDLDKDNLFENLVNEIGYPIYFENEANLSAIAEFSKKSEPRDLISLSIYSGFGTGIIIDGKIYKGFLGKAGEIGHSIYMPNGIECKCGNKGCLELYCSSTVFLSKISEIKKIDHLTAADVIEFYYKKEPKVMKIIDECCEIISIGINSICAMFSPQVVIINSPIFRRIPYMLEKVKTYLSKKIESGLEIRGSILGSNATLLGATILCVSKFLNIDELSFD